MVKTAFESYLLDNGYKPYYRNMVTRKYEKARDISTYHPIIHYIKHNDELYGKNISDYQDLDVFEIGLSEVGKPPTLCYPRPAFVIKIKEGDSFRTLTHQDDDGMNIMLSKFSHEEIYQKCVNRLNKDFFTILEI